MASKPSERFVWALVQDLRPVPAVCAIAVS